MGFGDMIIGMRRPKAKTAYFLGRICLKIKLKGVCLKENETKIKYDEVAFFLNPVKVLPHYIFVLI